MRALLICFLFSVTLTNLVVEGSSDCCNAPCNGSPSFSSSSYCCYGGSGGIVSGDCTCNAVQWSCTLGGSIASSDTTLSVARSTLTATAVAGSNYIFFAGGVNSGTVQNRVDIYVTTLGAFTSTISLSSARSNLASVSIGDYTLFAGGTLQGGSVSSAVDIYNSVSNSWSVGTLAYARANIVTATAGSIALFASGTPTGSANVDLFDSSTQTWTTALLSVARSGVVAVSLSGGVAVFAGGQTGGVDSTAVDYFDGTTWSTMTLSQGQQGMAGASVKNVAAFGGGLAAGSATANVFVMVYVPSAKYFSWSTKSLSVARSNLVATALGNYIIFAGGLVSGSGASNVVDILNVVSQSFLTPVTLNVARYSLSAAAFNGRALFGGGILAGGTVTTAVDVLLLPASWYVGNWTKCTLCSQTRVVYCMDISGQEQDASACAGAKPDTSQPNCCNPPYNWVTGTYSRCLPVGCGTNGVTTRSVACLSTEQYTAPDDRCDGTNRPHNVTTCLSTDCSSSTGSGAVRVYPWAPLVLCLIALLCCLF